MEVSCGLKRWKKLGCFCGKEKKERENKDKNMFGWRNRNL
jgi:hypothetical protein